MGEDRELFGGRYQTVGTLDEDAGCKMFRAVDRQHGRMVWLGVHPAGSAEHRREHLAFAQALLALAPHRGLPVIRDDFFDGDRHVLVRDWVEGTPLGQTLDDRGDPGLPPSAVQRWLAQAADVLDHLHRQHTPFPHGSICPGNLVLADVGQVVLVNAGMGVSPLESLARPWLAPEVLAGAEPTPASDIYGLAATAFTLLTGVEDVGDVQQWEGIDPALVKVAQRALRRGLDPDPARRPTSARELIERLEHAYEADLPTGELTFCLTDVENSTPQWEAHPDAMQEAMARLRDIIADLIDEHGGRLPRSQGEGDSTLSVFRRADAALATIVDVHRALAEEPWPDGIDLRIRAGLHTGSADVRDGDYFGPTVNRTARLRGLGGGRQTIVSAATASLVSDHLPAGTNLIARGEHKLKGLSRPEDVFELVDDRLPEPVHRPEPAPPVVATDPSWRAVPLPGALDRPEPTAYIGREKPRQTLLDRWDEVSAGRPLLVTVTGPPGIGKTRLVSEVARQVHDQGATVLFGRSFEENLRPYQSMAEAIRHLVEQSGLDHLISEVGEFGPLANRLLPELAGLLPQHAPPAKLDPETERFLLFESVVAILRTAARQTPVLLVLDDLHWADQPTLLLLCHLLRALTSVPLMVLATYRDVEVERADPLAHVLVDLRREGLAEQVPLAGLSDTEVARLIEAFNVDDAPPALTTSVSRDTEGNPFFIGEVLRHFIENDALLRQGGRWQFAADVDVLGVPETVRDLLDRRMGRLPADVMRVLRTASVIGRDFDLDVLAEASGSTTEDTLDQLEQALAARVLAEDPEHFGRYSFAHALIRQALYSDISVTRRAMQHRRVARAMQTLAGDDDRLLMPIARHSLAGAPAGDADTAITYALRAGAAAMEALAYEEAADLFQHGLTVVVRPDQRGDLLLALSEAKQASGDAPSARDIACEAVDLGRAQANRMLHGRAAVRYAASGAVGFGAEWGVVDHATVEVLEHGLDAIGPEDSPLRAQLLARLGAALYFSQDHARLSRLSDEALEMAHRMGDKHSMALALSAQHAARWLPGSVDERLDIAHEVLNLAEVLGDRELTLQGHAFLVAAHLELNDLPAVDDSIEAVGRLADEVRRPQYRWWKLHWDAMRAMLDGRLDEAEGLVNEALAVGQEGQGHNAWNTFGVQLLVLRMHQGRAGEFEDIVRANMEAYPDLPSWRTGLVIVGLSSGNEAVLREAYEPLASDGFAGLPRDAMWHAAIVMLASAAASLGDEAGASRLFDMLSPLSGRNVHIGAGAVYLGSVDLYLGRLATTLERWDVAEHHFDVAQAMHEAIGAKVFALMTSIYRRGMVTARNQPGDAQRAVTLSRQSLDRATELGVDEVAALAASDLAASERRAAEEAGRFAAGHPAD